MSARVCPCCRGPLPEGAVAREELAGLAGGLEGRLLVQRLARRPGHWVTTPDLVEAVYGDRADGGPDTANSVVRRLVFSLRKKLTALGWKIEGRNRAIGGFEGEEHGGRAQIAVNLLNSMNPNATAITGAVH